jgi:hypothetical protein
MISNYFSLKKPIFPDFKNVKNLIEEESTEEKKNDKEIKQNFYPDFYRNNNNNIITNIIINNDDILQEQKYLNSKFFNELFTQDTIPKKKIFSCKKRDHSIDNEILPPTPSTFQDSSDKDIKNEKKEKTKTKKTVYKKHDKMEKDNIVRKIQVHYCNFLINFINEIIQKIIFDESYKTINVEKIMHIKDYLFNNIDYKFKSNIKKDFMEKVENMKIKDIISPPDNFCELHNISNKNKQVMEKIILKNNSILNKILDQKYLFYFTELYSKDKRILDLKEDNESINIILSNETKMLNDLVVKNSDDKNYISKMKRVVMQNFIKPKYMFKIKK